MLQRTMATSGGCPKNSLRKAGFKDRFGLPAWAPGTQASEGWGESVMVRGLGELSSVLGCSGLNLLLLKNLSVLTGKLEAETESQGIEVQHFMPTSTRNLEPKFVDAQGWKKNKKQTKTLKAPMPASGPRSCSHAGAARC